MPLIRRLAPLILAALLLAGCQGLPKLGSVPSSPTAGVATATPVTAPLSVTSSAAPSDAEQAIKAVIQQANDEQQQAFAKNDATLMRDTATTDYYQQLTQIQSDMQRAGVASIKLIDLQWGQVSAQGASAQATTTETWRTAYSDGSTQQDRDRNVYALVLQGSAWKIQSDDHPDSNLNQPAPSTGVAPGTAPAPSTGAPGADQSSNWSGYAATGGTFTAVHATWTVPQVDASAGGSDATWVGIGGEGSHDLIQAGTDATVLGAGSVRYTAWVETLPQEAQTVPLTVDPGDQITVSVAQQKSGQWQITFDDHTSGKHYDTTISYSSSLSSAEWIEEAPFGGRRVLPLDNFGTVQFKDAAAVENGKQVTIAQAQATPITMAADGGAIAQPSPLGSDGASFSVTRLPDAPGSRQDPGFSRPRRRRTNAGSLPALPLLPVMP